jgi:hypothetical protein
MNSGADMTFPHDPAPTPGPHALGQWGTITGIVRGGPYNQPVRECSVVVEPTTTPSQGVLDIASGTTDDGRYELILPAATYTVRAFGGGSYESMHGEARDVVVAPNETTIVDIVITSTG